MAARVLLVSAAALASAAAACSSVESVGTTGSTTSGTGGSAGTLGGRCLAAPGARSPANAPGLKGRVSS